MKFNNDYMENYYDSYILTPQETKMYDVDAIYEKMFDLLHEVKKARNIYVNGLHARVTNNYEPKLEMFTNRAIDSIGKMVAENIDSEQAYNDFNIRLNRLYSVMSKPEIAYINDCVIGGISNAIFRQTIGLTRTEFEVVKASSIVRFGLAFNIVVYK